VRKIEERKYEILAGERRWRAAQLAGLTEVPVLIRSGVSDESAIEIAIIENVQREDLNAIEEAEVYDRLNREFGYTHEEIGHKIGKDRVTVTNKIRLLKLDPKIKEMMLNGQLTESFGLQLVSLTGEEQCLLAQQCCQNEWSIRKLQKEIKKLQRINTPSRNVPTDANISRLENRLSELLGTRVRIRHDSNQKNGEIIIGYANLDILDGLLDKWGILKATEDE
jgi:ParB family chromosome partitioning protein